MRFYPISATVVSSLALVGCGGAYDGPEALGSSESALSSGLTVKNSEKASFTSGTATNAPPTPGQPDVCGALGVTCVQFDLKIDLPRNVWHKAGGVQVAARWATDDNALDLYVYKDGLQVGKAEGFLAAISESLLLRSAENGTYQVYVALDAANSLDPSVPFEAEARVQFDPNVNPIRPLLPDFAMRPQTTLTFDTPVFPFFGDVADPGESCYRGEMAETGASVCMRFEQTFANVGEGAAELRFAVPKDPNDTSHDVLARTYFSDGHFTDTSAGTWEFHAEHQHFHYDNFVQSNLWAADSHGHRTGTGPIRAGRKVSFCMEDEILDGPMWGKAGVRPRFYIAPDCLDFVPSAETPDFNYLIQGVTPGWDDIYEWYLPGQYIDVAGVPSGDYVLETIADPDDKLVEPDETNNCGTVLIRLSNMGTTDRHAEIIGKGPGCKKH
jgi:Lysyl oxidase